MNSSGAAVSHCRVGSSENIDDHVSVREITLPNRQTPDASLHNPAPEYLRGLLASAGLSQREAARRLGLTERMMRYYVSENPASYRPAPYPVQYCLEVLAGE